MKKNIGRFFISFLIFSLSGCGAYFNQPLTVEKASFGMDTPASASLKTLPAPKEQIVVGIYKFRDQTGQYKPTETGSSFSTAVTQGATSILIKALEDSKWFVPIERENLANLLQERNIIRTTRQEYSKSGNQEQLAPLLYAGVLLEGGIVSYDTNILTGGFGARYFGAGGSTKYRQDRVTVYLRLISTQTGKIMKTVYVSKTILSQAIDASLFRYVNFKRLLEVETGFTKNEPIQLAVTEAIEKAVEGLVVEGIRDNIWQSSAPILQITKAINEYDKEKETAASSSLYGRNFYEKRGVFGIEISGGTTLVSDDYPSSSPRPMARGALKYLASPSFVISGSTNAYWLGNSQKLEIGYASLDLNLEKIILPYDRFTPYFFAGAGYNFNSEFENRFFKFQYGAGLEYLMTDNFGLKLYGEHNLTNYDRVDYLEAGTKKDSFLRFGLGVNYYFGKRKPKDVKVKEKNTFDELIPTK